MMEKEKEKNNRDPLDFTPREEQDLDEIDGLCNLQKIALGLLKIRKIEFKDSLTRSDFTITYNSDLAETTFTYVLKCFDKRAI